MKIYNKAPLPFQGQKRNMLKKFREALQDFPANALYIDLFGGSGLLSHTVKSVHPDAQVIYNDYDNYSERLANIDQTNKLIEDIKNILIDVPMKQRIEPDLKQQILNRIKQENGFVDFITVSSNVLFAGNYADSFESLERQTFYNRSVKTPYDATGYLKGVDVVCKDYRQLFDIFAGSRDVVFILDPPYLSTDVSTYSNETYWKLTDYLDVLQTIRKHPFFYFTSSKSQIVELLTWLTHNYGDTAFQGTTTEVTNNQINVSSKYQDIMILKKSA